MTIKKAVIIHPHIPQNRKAGDTPTRPLSYVLAEAVRLAESIGLEVITADILQIEKPHPATLLGRGVVESLASKIKECEDCLVIINAGLTPVQHRNLEQTLNSKVIDRTALILEIFGARAKSRAGRLQVELAALSFQRSRLVRSWTHLERQRGGGGFLGGPGERQIELDRRMLAGRIARIKTQLKQVERTRHMQRQHRQRFEVPTVALIGYTNAGKSSLFNALTEAGVMAADMLFATLDPSMRGVRLMPRGRNAGEDNGKANANANADKKANGQASQVNKNADSAYANNHAHKEAPVNKGTKGRAVILADTVGFISELPTELIAAFKSTLEEVVLADALLHVHDCASPVAQEEARDVTHVLYQLGMSEEDIKSRVIHVYNKCDLLDAEKQTTMPISSPVSSPISSPASPAQPRQYVANDPRANGAFQGELDQALSGEGVLVSATTGEGLNSLCATLDDYFAEKEHRLTIAIPFASGTSGKARAWLYRHGAVLGVVRDDTAGNEHISVVLSPANLARFTRLYPQAEWHET